MYSRDALLGLKHSGRKCAEHTRTATKRKVLTYASKRRKIEK